MDVCIGAQTTIDDFVRSYFFFHSLTPADFFTHFPILLFVECTIYQVELLNIYLFAYYYYYYYYYIIIIIIM
jgi:hypothetical protein